MSSLSLLFHINFATLLVSAALAFALGALWYNPKVFGTVWQKAQPDRSPSSYTMKPSDMVIQVFCQLGQGLVLSWLALVIAYGVTPNFGEWFAAWLVLSILALIVQTSNWIFSGTKLMRLVVDYGYVAVALMVYVIVAAIWQLF